ncbi:hypothetical protein [Streptomyces sp. NPDC048191]|uniref:hypothetical protein n=1 Tax=Streptomyces sp. NPDC048191 TaxID=3155484 RepID=UPI0033E5519D
MRRMIPTRRCTSCDTYNRVHRLTCFVCQKPMPGITRIRTTAAVILRNLAELADTLGWIGLLSLTGAAVVLKGLGLTLIDLLPALAAYGFSQMAVFLLKSAAQAAAETGSTWEDAANALGEVARKLEDSDNRLAAVQALSKHEGIAALPTILRAVALLSRAESDTADEAGDVQDALAKERLEDALRTAASELDADADRAWL